MKNFILMLFLSLSYSTFCVAQKIKYKEIVPLIDNKKFKDAIPKLTKYFNQNLSENGEWSAKALLTENKNMLAAEENLAKFYFSFAETEKKEIYADSSTFWYKRMIYDQHDNKQIATEKINLIQKMKTQWEWENKERQKKQQDSLATAEKIKNEAERQNAELKNKQLRDSIALINKAKNDSLQIIYKAKEIEREENYQKDYATYKLENKKYNALYSEPNSPSGATKKMVSFMKKGDLTSVKTICDDPETNKTRREEVGEHGSNRILNGDSERTKKEFNSMKNILTTPSVYFYSKERACVMWQLNNNGTDAKEKYNAKFQCLYFANVSGKWKIIGSDDRIFGPEEVMESCKKKEFKKGEDQSNYVPDGKLSQCKTVEQILMDEAIRLNPELFK